MKRAVFITGAAAGGGFAVASHFARKGWNVILTSRRREAAKTAAQSLEKEYGIEAEGYGLDVGEESLVEDIFCDMDRKDFFAETLVLYAANLGFGEDPAKGMDFLTVPVEEFRKVFETNLVWNFTIARQAVLRMKEKNKGAVVFLGSNTSYRAIPNRSAYCGSKSGINGLSRAMAIDLGPFGIRSNVILPGTIKTARWRGMDVHDRADGREAPSGQLSDYEDIANAVWYLGTDLSKNVTGTELTVDGGMGSQLKPRRTD